jgi:hypothetical protein
VELPVSSQLWVASLSSDEDDDDEVLAPHTPLASTEDVFGSVLGAVDVRHDEMVLVEPCDGPFVAAVALGDEEGWA